jgi:predicted double-glycine peptidase
MTIKIHSSRDVRRRGFFSAGISFFLVLSLPLSTQAVSAYDRVRSLAEIRYDGVIIQKWDLSCGAAALATLLTYDLGDPVSERAIATAMLRRTDPIRVRTRGGFSLLDMQEYAEHRGYRAEGYGEVSLDDLSQMMPAIVPVEFHGYEHFVVVRKIDGDQVHFADPAFGRRTLPISDFRKAWKRNLAFVVSAK